MIASENRAESNSKVNRQVRYSQILNELEKVYPRGLSVREIMNNLKFDERNYIAPRCTELVQFGKIKEIGKTYDFTTKRNITVYRLIKEGEF